MTLTSNAATTQTSIPAIALDATHVYWTNRGLSSPVMGRSLAGGPPITIASNQNEPRAIAIDATSVYWATYAPALMKASRGGGNVTALSTDSCGTPCAIAVNDTSVYWIACGSLMRLAK